MRDCQCCIGVETTTPATVQNVPGLSSIVYRVGEHGSFFQSMLARLDGDKDFGLRTRETDDFSIALLDAAAIVCELLSFYQERFANEHYLRTAKERQSLVGVGQLSGYRLAPGRAASPFLASTLDSPVVPPAPAVPGLPPGPYPKPGAVEGVPSSVVIPAGTKVQSVPGPGETPQIFESIEDIIAKPQWNSIPLCARAVFPSTGTASFNQLELAGFVSSLKEGDFVLVKKGSETPQLHQVSYVDGQVALNRTIVSFREGSAPSALVPVYSALSGGTAPADFDDSYVTGFIRKTLWNQPDLETIADARRWDADRLELAIRGAQARDANDLSVVVLGGSTPLFGHNARDYTATGGLEIDFLREPKLAGVGLAILCAMREVAYLQSE